PEGTSEKTVVSAPTVKEKLMHGTETIVVVEDDEAVRSLAKTALETFGYTVIAVTNGKDAVDYLLQNEGKVHLVLTDVIMPGMNGVEISEAINKLAPDVPLVFMSGYSADIIHKRSLLKENSEIIAKPFTPTVLLKKVREVLDKK
ncbi:MAG TPA: response regulator, partial [Bacteroidota bacterium]|nr:response regulator [Bacteroidota bacterium]